MRLFCIEHSNTAMVRALMALGTALFLTLRVRRVLRPICRSLLVVSYLVAWVSCCLCHYGVQRISDGTYLGITTGAVIIMGSRLHNPPQ